MQFGPVPNFAMTADVRHSKFAFFFFSYGHFQINEKGQNSIEMVMLKTHLKHCL